jgi:hypothetical protein
MRLIIGERFSYTYYDETCGEIWQSIEALDRMVSEREREREIAREKEKRIKYFIFL